MFSKCLHRVIAFLTTILTVFSLFISYSIAQESSPLDFEKLPISELRAIAEKGDTRAQRNLGLAYMDGRGVTKDAKEAASWFRKAAEKGDVGSQNNLGVMYSSGQGVPQDQNEAVVWFRSC